jgi:hypothetical protein
MTDQEEFEKLRKRLYALAEKMGQQITITMRRAPNPTSPPKHREPGEE